MAFARTWLHRFSQRPPALVPIGVVLLAALAAAIHFALAAEEARRQEAERAQALQLRLDTRLKLEALARQQEELETKEKSKQELARRDTAAFQQAALTADIASQGRDLRVQRRVTLERQISQQMKERERIRKALQKELINQELAKDESEACFRTFSRYESLKRDPASTPEKLASELAAVKEACKSSS